MTSVEERIGKELIPRQEFEEFLNDYCWKNHPHANSRFAKMLLNGELTFEDLKGFAKEFEHFLRFAPSHFFTMAANCPPDVIPDEKDPRRNFGVNLADDMGLTPETAWKDHFAKFRKFCYAIGLTKEEMDNSVPSPGTTAFNWAFLSTLGTLPHPEGMVVQTVANESVFLLGIVDVRDEAVRKHYGVEPWSPTKDEEIVHVTLPRDLVFGWADTPAKQARVFELYKVSYALWSMFYENMYNLTVGQRERVAA
ncbi:MAG: hypothetical protein ACE5IZ_00385 [Dehalococcoidia bacterium]